MRRCGSIGSTSYDDTTRPNARLRSSPSSVSTQTSVPPRAPRVRGPGRHPSVLVVQLSSTSLNIPIVKCGAPLSLLGQKQASRYLPGGRLYWNATDVPGEMTPMPALSGRPHDGLPCAPLAAKSRTCFLVVDCLTCWISRKCGSCALLWYFSQLACGRARLVCVWK